MIATQVTGAISPPILMTFSPFFSDHNCTTKSPEPVEDYGTSLGHSRERTRYQKLIVAREQHRDDAARVIAEALDYRTRRDVDNLHIISI